ncbi:MAG: OmpH family outer membrane protein [Boseongicola sp.]|nr:OmpH family outer membrane protein [Boseongicola sp.]NNJ69503.1 OmpH family outer membrane protein [Boseongicola sp.]
MSRGFCLWLVLGLCHLALPSSAQDIGLNLPPPILTIDQERLFQETGLGTRSAAAIETEVEMLAAENAEIESELIAREQELTERRATLQPDEFRALADAFDADVQRIRAAQDEKAREVNRLRDVARQEFFNDVAGIISDIVRERGALVVLDRRDVFLSADRIDITDEAIARVNAVSDSE